jgi:hypothetical protein
MAAPSPAVLLSHGRELMGNVEKETPCCNEQWWLVFIPCSALLPFCALIFGGGVLILMWECRWLPGPSIYFGRFSFFAPIWDRDLEYYCHRSRRENVQEMGLVVCRRHFQPSCRGNSLGQPLQWATGLLPNHLVSVDGTRCRIQEVSPFWSGWKSFKIGGAAVCYEVCLFVDGKERAA